jgi:hypothetical protein
VQSISEDGDLVRALSRNARVGVTAEGEYVFKVRAA